MCKPRVSYWFFFFDYDPFNYSIQPLYFQCPDGLRTQISGVGGINGLDLLLSRVEGFQVTNGYLKFLPAKPAEEAGGRVADRDHRVRLIRPRIHCCLVMLVLLYKTPSWWFGTFFIFLYIGNNHPN